MGVGTCSCFSSGADVVECAQDHTPAWLRRRSSERRDLMSTLDEWHPVVSASEEVMKVKRGMVFVNAKFLRESPRPWPRRQEIASSHYKVPKPDDLVVAISHAWPHQAHPDPLGFKAEELMALLDQVNHIHRPRGETLGFLDFCSLTQRPFREGQGERSTDEIQMFGEGIKVMPRLYLLVDAVLHIELDWKAVPGELEIIAIDASDLDGAILCQLGPRVQAMSHHHGVVRLFDVVVSVDGYLVENSLTVKDVWRKCEDAKSAERACVVMISRSPMGNRNQVAAGDRGWVYLERFVSMVKLAMGEPEDFERVCFSNSSVVLQQILDGGSRLREAAKRGEEPLQQVLIQFVQELDKKVFSAVSIDKQTNLGGIGGLTSGNVRSDREVVKEIMQDMAGFLPAHWAAEAGRQRERQLLLTVYRKEASDVRRLLLSTADANCRGENGQTCLHAAAKMFDVETVRVLLELGADCTIQDAHGNTPAHSLPLFTKPEVVQLFDMLAPSRAVLSLENEAGVNPARRLAGWAYDACNGVPYGPAQTRVHELKVRFPDVFQKRLTPRSPLMTQRSAVFHGTDAVLRKVCEISVGSKKVCVDTWESPGHAKLHMLYVCSLMSCAPLSPHEAEQATDKLARDLCARHSLKIFVINHYSLPVASPLETLNAYQERLLVVIDALPLQDGFILFDSSAGFTVRIIWQLRRRISGVAIDRVAFFLADGFAATDTWTQIQGFLKKVSQEATAKNADFMIKELAVRVYQPDTAEKARLAQQYKKELSIASEVVWDMWAVSHRNSSESADALQSLEPLDPIPAIVFCGDHAPSLMIQESTRRFQKACLPFADFCYLENSKQCWLLEGAEQVDQVCALLDNLVRSVLELQVSR